MHDSLMLFGGFTIVGFFQVKESLTHVQLLLDHQLMDMAWSDNLIDCEESLLKASVHLQSTPNSSQVGCADERKQHKKYPLYQMLCADLRALLHVVGRSGEAESSLPRAVDQVLPVRVRGQLARAARCCHSSQSHRGHSQEREAAAGEGG